MNSSSEYTEDIRSLSGKGAHKRGELFMQKLSGRKLLLIGFTLFSMFFGAGNLIFPPDLGAKAGIHFWPAFLGLAISAVGLPVAGVVAVARAQGLEKLAGRVHPVFAQVFMILIYLSIGPCLAIPRTASTSFAMLAPWWAPGPGCSWDTRWCSLQRPFWLPCGRKGSPVGWAGCCAPACWC